MTPPKSLCFRIEIAEAVIVRHDCVRERLAGIGADTREMDALLVGLWHYRNLLLQDLRVVETCGGGAAAEGAQNRTAGGADAMSGEAEPMLPRTR